MRQSPLLVGARVAVLLVMAAGCSSTVTAPSDNTAGSGVDQGNAVTVDGGSEGGASAHAIDSGNHASSGSGSGVPGGAGASSGTGSGNGASTGANGLGDAGSVGRDASAPPDSGVSLDGGPQPQPIDGGPTAPDGSGFPDPFEQHNLDVINMYRVAGGLRPLVLDATLSAFAFAGSQELTQDHIPHQHFMSAGKALFTAANGFRTSAGENQGDPNGWTVASQSATTNELTQIDQIMQAMFDEGPAGDAGMHGHY